jgi:predicted nucleic acid-binding protein
LIAIVDSAALYATVDSDDDDHARCLDVLQNGGYDFVIPALVVAEVTYLLGRRLGAETEARFLHSLSREEVEAPAADDWPKIAALVQRYANFPLGGTDASVAVLAERLGTDLIITLDRRHFGAIRMSDGRPFRLLPE